MGFNCAPLYETFNVYVSPSAYVFEPSSSTVAVGDSGISEKDVRESSHVDRKTGQLSLNVSSAIPLGRDKVITCYGIMGMITLATTDYLVIITQREPSCRLLSHPIFLATDFRLLPSNPQSSTQAILGNPIEKESISLVEQGLKAGNIWFSYGWDSTNTSQRQQEQQDAGMGPGKAPLWQRADERFFWNRFSQDRLIDATESGTDLSRFILPVMFGSLELRSATINNREFLFCSIARRSRHRVGTRYFSRGIDASGAVSNFNETEQIVSYDPLPEDGRQPTRGRVDGRERMSFVQVRGSVPIFWVEINNLRYKPDSQIMEVPETAEAFRSHMTDSVQQYGDIELVNLVNQKGYEQPVKEGFERAMASTAMDPKLAQHCHYSYFDFHAECKGMRFDRIQLSIDQLSDQSNKDGWYSGSAPVSAGYGAAAGPTKESKKQTGVIRSNCMDCLDRTNVAQSALGKWASNNQSRDAGILSIKETVDVHPEFMSVFRNVWADHADTISKAYSGTGALKTDFTRTGKRTKAGSSQDGYNSVMRYVKNNFFDGDRQDAYDLITGSWVARRGAIPPSSDTRPSSHRSMPYIFLFALAMILAALTLPRSSDWSIASFLLLWFLLLAISGTFMWGNGTHYVAWPRLNPPHAISNYSGNGFRSKQRGRGMSISKIVPVKKRRGDEIEMKRKGALID